MEDQNSNSLVSVEQKNQESKIYNADFLHDEKYVKILKANSVIRGRTVVDERGLKLNVYDFKVLNFLLKTLQECIKTDTKPVKFTTLVIPLELFKKVVDDSRNWRNSFIRSVEKLEKISFELNNYKDWDNDKFILWKKTRLVVNPEFNVDIADRKNATCEISFAQELSTVCWQKTDYTHLDFKTLHSFSSKYAIKFYESLISKIQYYTNCNNYKTEYDFRQEELENIFEVNFDSLNTTFVRFLTNTVEFQDVIVPDLKRKLDFEFEIHGKDRIITFKFQKDSLEQFRTRKQDSIDLSIEKFKNLIDSTKVYDDGNNRIYEIDKEKPDDAMAAFLDEIRQHYANKPLLKRSDEIKTFGDIAMNADGDLYYINSFKKISYGRSKRFLIYLYKNYYEHIMGEIKRKERETASAEVVLSDSIDETEDATKLNKSPYEQDPSLF